MKADDDVVAYRAAELFLKKKGERSWRSVQEIVSHLNRLITTGPPLKRESLYPLGL